MVAKTDDFTPVPTPQPVYLELNPPVENVGGIDNEPEDPDDSDEDDDEDDDDESENDPGNDVTLGDLYGYDNDEDNEEAALDDALKIIENGD